MILFEFEGKNLLSRFGINIPHSQLIESVKDQVTIKPPLVLKAQVLSGNRAKTGGIVRIENDELRIKDELEQLFGKTINKEEVKRVLVEEMAESDQEYYISISYDTNIRGPVLTIGSQGGTGVEERKPQVYPIDPLTKVATIVQNIVDEKVLEKLIKIFFEQDCLLLEINPLVKLKDGQWVALDAKVKLDDETRSRHLDWNFPPRSVAGHAPTKSEVEAKKIDEGDYRGTAGSTYFDLKGDIAILASGGGASLTAMDALLKVGGKPANYTEYSGNPPKEKVEKLTKIVLSKPNLHGLWVVGAVANFTDIYETLSGFLEGLRQAQVELGTKFAFPIVIRRGGPRDTEAFAMLREVKDFDLHLFGEETLITKSAEIMADLAKKYAATS